MTQLIKHHALARDEWLRVVPPVLGEEVVRKQAGKVVLFKLHGEPTFTPEQIAATLIPTSGKVILPLAVWQANKESLAQRMAAKEIGILIATHEPIQDLVNAFANLNQLPLIVVYVERFADGRIYTLGHWMRTRYNYKNELRAVGDVLRDQLFFLKRSGYDSYLIREGRDAKQALSGLDVFSQPYQGAVDDVPVWRRLDRAQLK